MYSDSDLDAAVTAGAMTPEAAAALRNFVAESAASPLVDEEHFRLLTGFNDIFVAIAAAILLVAVAWIGDAVRFSDQWEGPTPFSGLFVAATAWGLAEFFTLKRRMALPSIILLLAFVGGVFVTIGAAVGMMFPDAMNEAGDGRTAAMIGAVSAAVAAGAARLHWRRFRVPITIAAGAAAVVVLALALIASAIGESPATKDALLAAALVAGVGVFLFAMRWDSSDPTRQTRRSDVAFWLHLLSAPLIVHPVFSLLGLTDGNATILEAMVVVIVYVMLGLTALAIDRRALLVSALAYVLWALSDLFKRFGAVELNFALTAFIIGSALLLLSAFWHSARRKVVEPLPAGLRARLPVMDRPLTA
ncbi:hypothetical protein [Sphingosinicella rhizophila]|uniref:Membrane protein DUF2157 n=1 Tax=Sphingosinicella rhizophila TaxID=3050082 RepID=A0ABU3Q4U7_9SPHN|nr:hypothetical protein [Sphingosinicella sp. GR2756]MDT9598424.1 hypothetical protein [Sphingosinicella sp. GR2756]